MFRLFVIFDGNFAKIVAPPSDENENYVVHLKELSLLEKTLKTSLKSANKLQCNACLNYDPFNEQRSIFGVLQT